MLAAEKDLLEIAEMLVNAGASVGHQDPVRILLVATPYGIHST